jgi:hypothetical protein
MEAASALDGAKRRLQDAEPKPATRVKAPSYHVFKVAGVEGHFEHLTAEGAVAAMSRKDAIAKVSAIFNKEKAEAETFLVIPAKEFKLLTRKVKTEVVETVE